MANIKFKKILKEAAWDHTSGKSLPTLEDVQKAYEAKKHLQEDGNTLNSLKIGYYAISDEMININKGGIVDDLMTLEETPEGEKLIKKYGINVQKEIAIFQNMRKLFTQSKLGKML